MIWTALEFVLEVSGAVLSARRRLWFLFALLAFRAFADLAILPIVLVYGKNWAGVATWIAKGIQYLFAIALASQFVCSWIREDGASKLTIWASGIGAVVTVAAFILGDTWKHRFLHAEIAAAMSAGIVVAQGWIFRKKPLEKIQAGIAAGLVISLAGNGFCAMLWQVWDGATFLYPIPAIAALIVWNWAARPQRIVIAEYRRDVPPKFEPTSVRSRQISERVN